MVWWSVIALFLSDCSEYSLNACLMLLKSSWSHFGEKIKTLETNLDLTDGWTDISISRAPVIAKNPIYNSTLAFSSSVQTINTASLSLREQMLFKHHQDCPYIYSVEKTWSRMNWHLGFAYNMQPLIFWNYRVSHKKLNLVRVAKA